MGTLNMFFVRKIITKCVPLLDTSFARNGLLSVRGASTNAKPASRRYLLITAATVVTGYISYDAYKMYTRRPDEIGKLMAVACFLIVIMNIDLPPF